MHNEADEFVQLLCTNNNNGGGDNVDNNDGKMKPQASICKLHVLYSCSRDNIKKIALKINYAVKMSIVKHRPFHQYNYIDHTYEKILIQHCK